jgi:hypothetical protein
MSRKRFSAEEIVNKLRQADVELVRGKMVADQLHGAARFNNGCRILEAAKFIPTGLGVWRAHRLLFLHTRPFPNYFVMLRPCVPDRLGPPLDKPYVLGEIPRAGHIKDGQGAQRRRWLQPYETTFLRCCPPKRLGCLLGIQAAIQD